MTASIQTNPATERGAQRKRSIIRPVVVSFAVLIAFAGVIEAALRYGLGLGNPVLITPDAACSYILKPDQDVVRFFVNTHINHFGMRSDEVQSVRRPDALRLLFVGDSITYGTSRVDQKAIFTELLHRDLPAMIHRPVEVLNASAGAWAPDNELAFLQSRGVFQANIVFVVLNDGDLTQPRSTVEGVGEDLPQRRPATAIGELYTRYIRPRVSHLLTKTDAGDNIAMNSDPVIKKNMADLDSMYELVKKQGATFVIVYIPFKRDIPQMSQASELALKAWSETHRVSMYDLTSAEAPYTSSQITLDSGIHFNARGHLVIAQAIESSWRDVVGDR